MFFSKFFKKQDHNHFLAQAAKYLSSGRYADARVDFLEAQSCCPADDAAAQEQIRQGLIQTGNHLAELNLEEGGHALNMGELQKAYDNFALAHDLADDPQLRSRAQAAMKKLEEPQETPQPAKAAKKAHGGSSCASCGPEKHTQELPVHDETGMHEDDRFFLLVQPLPGDLPARYAAMGEKFVEAYLLIHEGDDARAFPILQQLLLNSEDDIVNYELALIMYRAGRVHECEELLNRSLKVNPGNPASYLALVHLKADTRRFGEGIALLKKMQELGILVEQAQYMLGDLHEAAGNRTAAVEAWSRALEIPAMARAAAERLVPILASQGREADAKFLAKKYLKGCC